MSGLRPLDRRAVEEPGRFAHTLVVYPDDGAPIRIPCANGFVSRVVSAVFHSEQSGCYVDAQEVARLLNAAEAGRQAGVR